MEDNPYRAPMFDDSSPLGIDRGFGPGASDLSEAEIRAFVGRNAEFYLRKWSPARRGSGRPKRWNFAAFFLSGLWVPYRKMYRVTLIILGILVAESLLEEAAIAGGLASERMVASLNRLIGILFSIVCGTFGNAWYLAHAQREIGRIRALGLEDDAYHKALARRGGTSFLASLGFLFLFILAGVGIAIVSEFLFSGD